MNVIYNGIKYSTFKKEIENINISEITIEIVDDSLHCLKNNFVHIYSFYSTKEKQGYGSKALKEIIKIANKYQVNLYLFPAGTSERFYKKFGFIYPENSKNYYIPMKLYFLCNEYSPIYQKIKSVKIMSLLKKIKLFLFN
ncbi:N-acetyltransferase [Fusobacterium ulcerans]|uniref:N-acetyltransferase domain-containing protein n=1 Tax=Fusobacterium ulcerans TaxID=861 RepID=A0AAX2JBU2_9FUSO|nr:GNAT family N-acetyltransferase [Fusobacterium ulcerans]AVQ26595.1 N-acetyltransferase [Fusobacterium ulcerans]EFS25287.1 hypothetical protein FUAG_00802 [Fusobacterium ulcerans ATCC 49185]SQJ05661.1 Uncharacterised protein [Fusobacterium ulcerans]